MAMASIPPPTTAAGAEPLVHARHCMSIPVHEHELLMAPTPHSWVFYLSHHAEEETGAQAGTWRRESLEKHGKRCHSQPSAVK